MSREIYCELVGKVVGVFGHKVQVEVDFGQEARWFRGIDSLADKEGNVISFNSMVDALNYMANDGWCFVSALSVTRKNDNVYHYIMRKTVESSSA